MVVIAQQVVTFIVALVLALQMGNFAMATNLTAEMPGILPRLQSGEFEENSEHFWEKSPVRQKAMIISMVAFLGISEELLCDQKVVMFNATENKLAVVCDIHKEGLTNGHSHPELFEVGILIFALDNPTPFLLTIIPSQWRYACSLTRSRGYEIILNDGIHPCNISYIN